MYGSLTCQGIGLDGIPEVTASEGFIVNEINKVRFMSSRWHHVPNYGSILYIYFKYLYSSVYHCHLHSIHIIIIIFTAFECQEFFFYT